MRTFIIILCVAVSYCRVMGPGKTDSIKTTKPSCRTMEFVESRSALNGNNWANNAIIYDYDGLTADDITIVEAAMKQFTDGTCLTFQKKSSEQNYISIQKVADDGCYTIGLGQATGKTPLNLGDNCMDVSTAAHELMHVAGFEHEHTRIDRDDYVVVHWDVCSCADQMGKSEIETHTDFGTYDYTSVMHYEKTACSNTTDGYTYSPVLTAVAGKVAPDEFSNRKGLTTEDIKKINLLYKCPGGGVTNAPVTTTTAEPTDEPETDCDGFITTYGMCIPSSWF